jgi:hypothetical protein
VFNSKLQDVDDKNGKFQCLEQILFLFAIGMMGCGRAIYIESL